MKKMSMSTLARGNLKGKRKQYLTLFFGVFFAMLFSMSALFFVSSFRASVRAKNEHLYGKANQIILNANREDWTELDQFMEKPEIGFAHLLGACVYERTDNIRYLIGWLDEKAKELYNAELIEGAYPIKENEIAIEQTTLLVLGLDDKQIGDTLTLEFQVQNGKDVLPKPVKKTYVLSGILYDKFSNIIDYFKTGGIPSLLVCENSKPELGGKENRCAYLRGKNFDFDNMQAFGDYIGGSWNQMYLDFARNYDPDGKMLSLYIVLTIFAVSLLLVSCVGIVNAFRSRLDDRKTQIGLLRAVGTTRRQIVRLYSREALLLCLLATPLAFLGAFFAVRLLLRVMANGLIFTPQWWVLSGSAAISVGVVLLASLIPLHRASRISPMQAIRNTEIIRTMANKKIKSQISFDVPSLLSRRSRQLFKKRQILTAIMLTVSVLVAAFGFTMVSVFSNEKPWLDGDYALHAYAFDNVLTLERGNKRGWTFSELAEMKTIPEITSVSGYGAFPAQIQTDALTEYDKLHQLSLYLYLEEDDDLNLDPDMLENFKPLPSLERLKVKGGYKSELLPVTIVFATDVSLLKDASPAVREGTINWDALDAGREMLLYAPPGMEMQSCTNLNKRMLDFGYTYYEVLDTGRSYMPRKDYKVETVAKAESHFHAGDVLPLSVLYSDEKLPAAELRTAEYLSGRTYTRSEKTVTVGALLQEELQLNTIHPMPRLILYTTANALSGFVDRLQYSNVQLFSDRTIDEAADKRIMQTLNRFAAPLDSADVFSKYVFNQKLIEDARMAIFAVLSICLVFFTMTGSLINNDFTSRIRSGKRQIGTLRAVGASMRELVASYRKELLWLFTVSFSIGTVLYVAFNPVFVRFFEGQWKGFLLTPWVLLAVGGSALLALVCSLNLRVQLKKLTKDSIVDNIRELG